MHYASPRHERLYRNIIRNKSYPSRTLASLYLLTVDRKLWRRWCQTVSNQGIDWTSARRTEVGWDGYFLERAALWIARQDRDTITKIINIKKGATHAES